VRSFAPHPVICRDPEPVSSKTGQSLQTTPRSCVRLDHSRRPRSTRERCASPTSATDSTTRAPCGLLDSRLRPRLTRRLATSRAFEHRLTLGLGPHGDEVGASPSAYQMSPPGGASLDGEPPASASVAIRPAGLEVGAPGTHVIQTLRGPGGASIDCSSAPSLPVAAFSTADRACDVASDALSHDPPRTWSRDRIPFAWGRWIHLRRRLVKDDDLAGSERLPSTSSPSPCASGFRRMRVDHGELSPVSLLAARVLVAFATAIRHSALLCPLSLPEESQRLDPWSFDQDPAPLVDFCNPNNPRARPRDRPIPPCAAGSSWEQAPWPWSRKRPHSPSVRSRAPLAPGALALEVLTRYGGLRLALVAYTSTRACAARRPALARSPP
jgi:hypothetical protein